MSSLAHTDLETVPPTVGAHSSLVPTPFHDDRYLVVRHAYLHTTRDIKSETEEAPSETDEFQPPSTRSAPLSSDHTPILPDRTPVSPLTDKEFEAFEPSDTRITSPHTTTPSYSTTALSPDHSLTQKAPTPTHARAFFYRKTARMGMHTQPAMPLGLSARVTKAMTLSPSSSLKRYRSSYETPSSSPTLASPQTLPLRKRYRGTSKLVESSDTETEGDESEADGADSESEESKDEGPDLEREETASGDQQQAVPVEDTAVDEPLGMGYGASRRCALELAEDTTPSTFEIRQSSRSVADRQGLDETPTPRFPIRTTWVDPVTLHLDGNTGRNRKESS
ncbi:hypothetical protein Tco_0773268 [Tanacetum coccineum]|uniref:Uncharacterized protein n=1 Tax=Tanacetum coccineum TaxID=301880 RepID=A0ABQ4ZL82_9ASTR